jgi:hypothetical protein
VENNERHPPNFLELRWRAVATSGGHDAMSRAINLSVLALISERSGSPPVAKCDNV